MNILIDSALPPEVEVGATGMYSTYRPQGRIYTMFIFIILRQVQAG